ncbi:MAG: hypothetical protein OEY66_08330 [Gammaproteobacteria bacterium]|nr:hypothetical protein [Gammaproteobacteria bacterium]
MSLKQLHRRMDAYHIDTIHNKKSQTTDIKSTLLKYVDNIVVEKSKIDKHNKAHNTNQPVTATSSTSKYVRDSHLNAFPFITHISNDNLNPYTLNKKQINELSKYFKERKKGSDLHPSVKEKLKDSIWEHINAAIQCAHKGDRHNSKMHVDIANYAFKEVAHYMNDEQYAELSEKISERMNVLNTNKQ